MLFVRGPLLRTLTRGKDAGIVQCLGKAESHGFLADRMVRRVSFHKSGNPVLYWIYNNGRRENGILVLGT